MLAASKAALFILIAARLPAQDSQSPLSFQTKTTAVACPTGGFPGATILGDFNGDHIQDITIQCSTSPQSFELLLLLGRGDGTFQAPLVTVLPDAPDYGTIIAVDINHDGLTDLAMTERTGSGIITAEGCGGRDSRQGPPNLLSFWLAQRNGVFVKSSTTVTVNFYDLHQAVDINGDGLPDLVLSDEEANTQRLPDIGVMLGRQDGSFAPMVSIPTGTSDCPGNPTIADLSNNHEPDLVLDSTPLLPVSLMTNQGNLMFSTRAPLPNGPTGSVAAIADFNGDGNLDIALNGPRGLSVLFGDGKGGFTPASATLPLFREFVYTADFNGDHKADLLQVDSDVGHISLSNGDGSFQVVPPLAEIQGVNFIADFNGDGKPDIAYYDPFPSMLSIYLNTSSSARVTAAINGASFSTNEPLTPGSLGTLFGVDFAAPGVAAEAGSIPLPLSLGQVSVTIGGFPAPLLYVSPTQINVQVPWEVTGVSAPIVVTVNGTPLPPFQATIGPLSPAIFTTQSGAGQAIAINNADSSLAGPSGSIPGLSVHPAKAGDILLVLGTGLGAVSPSDKDGAASSDVTRYTVTKPAVTIGGRTAQVSFSGLAPQFVGVNQLNVIVPAGVSGVVPLQISAGGIKSSDQVTIAVQ
ncbi:MAG TPA: FG-GAP-like repeat-containing protein [Bryobacteraceae bacterium]|nr:FG-GAP-like repeat-containing protein [Bryobacteraceae bacterium]